MPCPAGSFPYVIQSGDNFWRLAQQYGTTWEAIAAMNPGANPYNLRVGDTICIPRRRRPGSWGQRQCPAGLRPYAIQPGDTLGDIAWRMGTSVEAILQYNPVDPYRLRVGQILCIP